MPEKHEPISTEGLPNRIELPIPPTPSEWIPRVEPQETYRTLYSTIYQTAEQANFVVVEVFSKWHLSTRGDVAGSSTLWCELRTRIAHQLRGEARKEHMPLEIRLNHRRVVRSVTQEPRLYASFEIPANQVCVVELLYAHEGNSAMRLLSGSKMILHSRLPLSPEHET